MAEILKKARAVLREGSAELKESPARLVALGSAALSLAVAWGGVYESSLTFIGTRVIEATHNPFETAMATGFAAFGEQALLGTTISIAIANIPRTMAAIRGKFYAKAETSVSAAGEPITSESAPFRHALDRTLGALALGTSLSVLLRNRKREYGLGENVRNALIDAGILGSVNAALGAGGAVAANLSIAAGLEGPTETALNLLPVVFVGTYAAHKLGPIAVKAAHGFIQEHFVPEPSLPPEP